MTANKYYVVWVGYAPGVYDSWDEAQIQVEGYPDASYRSFKTQEEAVQAFRDGYDKKGLLEEMAREVKKLNAEGQQIEWDPEKAQASDVDEASAPKAPASGKKTSSKKASDKKASTQTDPKTETLAATPAAKPVPYILDAIAVDAACSGNPGPMEYKGVYVRTGKVLFKVGPMPGGTNNIGEFLAIVHALALQQKQGLRMPIYSDSVNAQLWIKQKTCKTKLEKTELNAPIFQLISRAEFWLRNNTYNIPIIKWNTKAWGEIPADFGRK